MADTARPKIHFHGTTDNVVQAGDVHGGVHLHGPTAPLPTPRQLPADVTHFTGRATELARLDALVADRGIGPTTVVISTIAGIAGVGKTALAVHWAHWVKDQFPDGQLYVNLRGYDPGPPATPEEAVEGFLRALDVPAEKIPRGLGEQTALFRSLLNQRQVLLVLDNAASSAQVRPLLPGSPGCVVVVTSRGRLSGLVAHDGACRITLDPMTAGDALALLRQIIGSERVDADPPVAAALVERCGYLPLALRIAAERAVTRPHITLADLVEELASESDRLEMLAVDDDETMAVGVVFSWSYRALRPEAARLFRLLGLHAGPTITSAATAALAGTTTSHVKRLLDVLTRMHLLEQTERDRYQVHDLLRLYASDRADAEETDDERKHAVRRELTWYLHTANHGERVLHPNRNHVLLAAPEPACWPLAFMDRGHVLTWFEGEHQNLMAAIRQAADTGEHAIVWKLANALSGFFNLRKHHTDWAATGRLGLAAARRIHDRYGEATMLNMLGMVLSGVRRHDEALDYLQQSLVLWRTEADQRGEGRALNNIGFTLRQLGQLDAAENYLRQALALARQTQDRLITSFALSNLGETLRLQQRPDEAAEYLRQALIECRETGERWCEGFVLNNLAAVYQDLRQPIKAIEYLQQALAVRREISDPWGKAQTLQSLGNVMFETGQLDPARQSWHQALAIFEDLSDPQADEVRACLDALKLPAAPNIA